MFKVLACACRGRGRAFGNFYGIGEPSLSADFRRVHCCVHHVALLRPARYGILVRPIAAARHPT
jgi:hypothetical protein